MDFNNKLTFSAHFCVSVKKNRLEKDNRSLQRTKTYLEIKKKHCDLFKAVIVVA